MAYLKPHNYADGRNTFSRHQSRPVDSRFHSSSFASQSSEEENVWYLDANYEDISRRIDRVSRDFAVQLTKLTHFQLALSILRNLETENSARNPYSCQRSGLNNWLKPSIQERKRSNIESTGNTLQGESGLQIKELTKKLEEKERNCIDRDNTISCLRNNLKQKDIELDDRDYKIKTLKNEVKKGKSTIREQKNELEINDAKILELKKQSKIKCNTYAELENTRKEHNSLNELNSKLGEYKRNIEYLERNNKIKEDQLSNENKKYRNCLTEQQKTKTDFEKIISSLQSAKCDLEKDISLRDVKIKDLEKELKARNENDHARIVTSLPSESKEASQKVSDLETKLQEALQKLRNKEEDLRVLETSYQNKIANLKADFTRLDTKFKSQQKSITSDEVKCNKFAEVNKDLHKKIEEMEKQVRLQQKQYQEDFNQMQEREREFVTRIDLQKKEIRRLEDELRMSKDTLGDLKKSMHSKALEKNTNEVKADADQRKKIAELKKQLREALTKLHDTETELSETKSRLSKVMGNRLTDNNPNITDLSDRNRPTKLAEKYAELYDNQWTDAFDVLEKSYHREEYVIETLLHILQDVFTFCLKKAKAQMKNLGQELKFADREDKGDVTVDVRKHLKECRKAVGFTENLPKMYQSYLEQSTNDRTKTALKVRAFTAECLEMCWYMVIQDPPVAFAPILSKGSSFDTDFYKPYTISGAKVDFVVWPPLLLQEGGQILAKGVAQGCGKKTAS